MSDLFLVRHGPTHEKAFVGHRDVPADLSDTGALLRLSRFLPDEALIVSSDLSRAVATADAIQGRRVRLPHEFGLREFDFGLWDGLHFTQVSTKWPELSRQYWEEPGDIAPPKGESWNSASQRVSAAVDRLKASAGGAPLVVVAHFGAILTQVRRATKSTAYEAFGHKIDNLSVTHISTEPTWRAERINHLA